jgi:hypothetical protein
VIDFFARKSHFLDHSVPIHIEMGGFGNFYVPPSLEEYALKSGVKPYVLKPMTKGNDQEVAPPLAGNPLVVASIGDFEMAWNAGRRSIILMEHGPGLTFPGNSSYAGNFGLRAKAQLTLAPNQLVYNKTAASIPNMKQEIIGTPMLDPLFENFFFRETFPSKPTIAIAFHWDGSRVAPEAGNAYRHYSRILPTLAKQSLFKLIAHGHPRNLKELAPYYESIGIEVVYDFREVTSRAQILINDCSSIAYMFLATGNPVILLNAPWFRRNVNHGLRFWEYTDIGEMVDSPGELLNAIDKTLLEPTARIRERMTALNDLFPYPGNSAQRAVHVINQSFDRRSA